MLPQHIPRLLVPFACRRSAATRLYAHDALPARDGNDTNSAQPFFGAMGCTSAIVFTCFGAAYGTAKAGVGVSAMGVLRPDLIVKSAFLMSPFLDS